MISPEEDKDEGKQRQRYRETKYGAPKAQDSRASEAKACFREPLRHGSVCKSDIPALKLTGIEEENGMNYLQFMDRMLWSHHMGHDQVRYLVTGADPAIRDYVFHDIAGRCRNQGKTLYVVDDTGQREIIGIGILQDAGYRLQNGLSGSLCLYDPFHVTSVRGTSRFRQILESLGYNEHQKAKLLGYFHFLIHLENLTSPKSGTGAGAEISKGKEGTASRQTRLSAEVLCTYSSVSAVEERLQELVDSGIISESERFHLLSKYAECSSAAADFEDMLFILMPFIRGKSIHEGASPARALVFPTGELGEDEAVRTILLQLLRFGLEEGDPAHASVLVFDKGFGQRKSLFTFLTSLPTAMEIHVFSDDIFTLSDDAGIANLLNRFNTRIYSRHLTMDSCKRIEEACGEIDIVKNARTTTYDRRLFSNAPWDILLGTNRTEAYVQAAPVREPRYRKEMICRLSAGNGIIDFMGQTSLFAV